MVEQAERLWTYDAVEPGAARHGDGGGHHGGENIAGYAEVALNDDPRYRGAAATLAMPTMVLSYAVLLREEIAEANGFVNYELVADCPKADPVRQVRNPVASARERRRRHHRPARSVGEVRAPGQPVRHLPRRGNQPARRKGRRVRLHLHLRLRQGATRGAGGTTPPQPSP